MISRSIRLFSDEELKEQRERKEDALRRILYEEYDNFKKYIDFYEMLKIWVTLWSDFDKISSVHKYCEKGSREVLMCIAYVCKRNSQNSLWKYRIILSCLCLLDGRTPPVWNSRAKPADLPYRLLGWIWFSEISYRSTNTGPAHIDSDTVRGFKLNLYQVKEVSVWNNLQ